MLKKIKTCIVLGGLFCLGVLCAVQGQKDVTFKDVDNSLNKIHKIIEEKDFSSDVYSGIIIISDSDQKEWFDMLKVLAEYVDRLINKKCKGTQIAKRFKGMFKTAQLELQELSYSLFNTINSKGAMVGEYQWTQKKIKRIKEWQRNLKGKALDLGDTRSIKSILRKVFISLQKNYEKLLKSL